MKTTLKMFVALAKGLWKVKSFYSLVVVVLPNVSMEHNNEPIEINVDILFVSYNYRLSQIRCEMCYLSFKKYPLCV